MGVDQISEYVDEELYEELKSFLYSYFCEKDIDNTWCSSIDNGLTRKLMNHKDDYFDSEIGRTIPGGRYGCA